MKALAFKPEDRYSNVVALQQEITRHLSGYPTDAEHANIITSFSLLMKRHNQMASMLIFFLLMTAILISANSVVLKKKNAEAVAARIEAENNFLLYRNQQKQSLKLSTELADSLQSVVMSQDYKKARDMLRVLEAGLKQNLHSDEKKELIQQKGTLHFVLQQFKAATRCFEEAGVGSNGTLQASKKLSTKYAKLKPLDREQLTTQQLTDLIAESPPIHRPAWFMYHRHMIQHPVQSAEDYLPLAEIMLKRLNRGNEELKLTQKDGGYHLDLSGSKYTVFTLTLLGNPTYNVLAPLKLYSLDISHTPLDNLMELRGLKLKELRMVGLNITKTGPLGYQLGRLDLNKLIIDADEYPKNFINKLREKYEVVEE